MPLTPSTLAPGTRRRSVLAGALGVSGVLGLTTSCSSAGAEEDGSTGPGEDAPGARRLRRQEARRRSELLGRYDRTLAVHGGLAERLGPLRAAVARQTEELGGKGPARTRDVRSPAVPEDEKAALTALAEAEKRAAEAHTGALGQAPPRLARLLASVAAAGAAHAYLLGKGKDA